MQLLVLQREHRRLQKGMILGQYGGLWGPHDRMRLLLEGP